MNNKGFTLVELLSTITIMTLVATMATVNIVKIFDEKEKSSKETINSVIEESACVYIELDDNKDLKKNCLTYGCNISSNTLINAGLLNEKDVLKEVTIHIEKLNNEKKCSIMEG